MDTSQQINIERNPNCWYHEVCTMNNKCTLCNKYTEMKFLMESSNLPKYLQQVITLYAPECDRDAYRRLGEIKSDIRNFVEQGKNLYISSKYVGNGKSSWSIKLMHKYFEQIWDGNGLRERALFISVPDFLMQLKDFDSKDSNFIRLRKLVKEVDLVVWDDIASTNMSAYDYSQILPIINHRIMSHYSNIYTSNCETKADLNKALGDKIASRILSKDTEVVIFKSRDMR